MLLESARGAAAFPAYTTSVRLFPCVHLYMHMQVAYMTKRLTTNLAAKRRHVALQGGFLMRAVHSIGSLVAHVRGLSSVGSSSISLSTNHLSSILHPNNVNVVLVWTVWVDRRKRLGTTVGRSRASVASTTFCLHMPWSTSRSRIPLPVLHPSTLREAGCMGAILGIFISNTRRSEHVLWCAARAMPAKVIISLIGPEVPFIFNLYRNTLFMTHAGTPFTPRMITILFLQQRHGWTIWENSRRKRLSWQYLLLCNKHSCAPGSGWSTFAIWHFTELLCSLLKCFEQ